MKNLNEMTIKELEEEYEKGKSITEKSAKKDIRCLEIGEEVIKRLQRNLTETG